MMLAKTDWIDKRADVAALLSHPVRRQIRDLLRNSDPLTLTEIARSIGHSEPNTYYHLNEMLKANIVVKTATKINGRLVTLYTLSDYYNELFGDVERKPDVLPIYVLFAVYSLSMILTLVLPSQMLSIYRVFGINTVHSALLVNLVGFVTSAVILIYYLVPELIAKLKDRYRGE